MPKTQDKYDDLIVDDNFDQANILKLLVEFNGFKARFYTNSEIAYRNIIRFKPKLVMAQMS